MVWWRTWCGRIGRATLAELSGFSRLCSTRRSMGFEPSNGRTFNASIAGSGRTLPCVPQDQAQQYGCFREDGLTSRRSFTPWERTAQARHWALVAFRLPRDADSRAEIHECLVEIEDVTVRNERLR